MLLQAINISIQSEICLKSTGVYFNLLTSDYDRRVIIVPKI